MHESFAKVHEDGDSGAPRTPWNTQAVSAWFSASLRSFEKSSEQRCRRARFHITLAVVAMIVEGCGLVVGRYIGVSQVYVCVASMYVRP